MYNVQFPIAIVHCTLKIDNYSGYLQPVNVKMVR